MSSTLMIQGCTSDAGKTTLVAGLCRVLQRKGIQVAPFKPQNMALNSAVTPDGGEIGRAQALQAQAAKVPLSVHFNPVLLKPNSDTGAQVILQGQAIGNLEALDYHDYKPKAFAAVMDSYQRLQQDYEVILVEGAGSPAEVNLRANDIANMGFAEAVDCPVILVADIDRGGVFAHLIGTLACLSESEQARIQGFVINRFRGDLALLQDGLDWLEAKTNKPVLGVLPYLHGLTLDAEDSVHHDAQAEQTEQAERTNPLKVICPLLPHISNHTDLDPLIHHPQVDFQWVKHEEAIPPADLIILPGSKSVAFDLAWLKSQGWQTALQKHLRYGGKLIGICGGLQMLGQTIFDPLGIESEHAVIEGLHLMNYTTELQLNKTLKQVSGYLNFDQKVPFSGYEIHCGITQMPKNTRPGVFLNQNEALQADGALSEDLQIFATYCHGLFDTPEALHALLKWAGQSELSVFDMQAQKEAQIERLADTLESHLDISALLKMLSPQETHPHNV